MPVVPSGPESVLAHQQHHLCGPGQSGQEGAHHIYLLSYNRAIPNLVCFAFVYIIVVIVNKYSRFGEMIACVQCLAGQKNKDDRG